SACGVAVGFLFIVLAVMHRNHLPHDIVSGGDGVTVEVGMGLQARAGSVLLAQIPPCCNSHRNFLISKTLCNLSITSQ
ncbi:MAG TPA: hypothetical protein VL995_07090, partial [Cellvibrio sp.]|nr:hypothetical protein [Cellvibrio sp.]